MITLKKVPEWFTKINFYYFIIIKKKVRRIKRRERIYAYRERERESTQSSSSSSSLAEYAALGTSPASSLRANLPRMRGRLSASVLRQAYFVPK